MNKIIDFINSDTYLYISVVSLFLILLISLIYEIVRIINERKAVKRWVALCKKYHIPDIPCPSPVVEYVTYIVYLCDRYGLKTFAEGCQKFKELRDEYFLKIKQGTEEDGEGKTDEI